MGRPKALVELDGVPLVLGALAALRDGGCRPLYLVVGAAAEQVAEVVAGEAVVVVAPDWADGMAASLGAGLAALPPAVAAVLVHLVDLPGVGAPAIARLRGCCDGADVLARAVYDGVPGHPVVLGRRHWPAVCVAATGDSGAREYLAGNTGVRLVECGDIADARDVDTPEELRGFGPAAAPKRTDDVGHETRP